MLQSGSSRIGRKCRNLRGGLKMKINEIFYSLQGEGRHTGTPAVFVRFAGCNLKCSFCDTMHQKGVEMTPQQIIDEINKYPAKFVVLTGGEPTMQVNEKFVDKLHENGFYVTMETNGTLQCPNNIDWITCSPKYRKVVLKRIDEIKVVYEGQDMEQYNGMVAKEYYLQPCDYKDEAKNQDNINQTINFIKQNPKWKLSLQTQKILNVQ